MNAKMLHDHAELRKLGIKALTEALGPVGMVRFLGQYEKGTGDYIRSRQQWLKGRNVAALIREIKKK